jgi:hypothetical protein
MFGYVGLPPAHDGNQRIEPGEFIDFTILWGVLREHDCAIYKLTLFGRQLELNFADEVVIHVHRASFRRLGRFRPLSLTTRPVR